MIYPQFGDDWWRRWRTLRAGRVLHRVARLDDPWSETFGWTACGGEGLMRVPTIREGPPRCTRCCRAVGIPRGNGAPANDKTLSAEERER